jgi:hypothetical protein
MVRAR